MLKRIRNELRNSDFLKQATFDEESNQLTFVYGKNNNYVSLYIPLYYPFYPPKDLKVNYKSITYFKMGNQKNIYKYFKINCLCCHSALCSSNWSPGVTIQKLIIEYELFKDIINCSVLFFFLENKNKLNNDVLKVIASYIKS